MKHVDRLLNDLNNMTPLSSGFWNDLQPLMKERHEKANHILLTPGKIAKKAWQLVTGFVIAVKTDDKGVERVKRIFYPKDIVTDLLSFYEEKPIQYKYFAATQVILLEITKNKVASLNHYPETAILKQHIVLMQNVEGDTMTDMLLLPTRERVKFFLEQYPTTGLPEKYCASLLNVSLDKYMKITQDLAPYIKPKELPLIGIKDLENTKDPGFIIKQYLIANYKDPASVKIERIADNFNMSVGKLNRAFEHRFGMTVQKFILKRRMEEATKLITSGDYTIHEAGVNVGFENFSHFSTAFKKYFGFPPKDCKPRK